MTLDEMLLMSYTVFNKRYKNGSFRSMRGLQDANGLAKTPTLGTISQSHDTCMPMRGSAVDVKPFSLVRNAEVKFLVANVVTPVSGVNPPTTWSYVSPPTPPFGTWAVMARDIPLQSPAGTAVATNPHGLAQVGRWVYIIDYDSPKIVIMDPNELNGLADGETCVLEREPFDLSSIFEDYEIANPRGWGIIALPEVVGTTVKNHLYVLYHNTADTITYFDSFLIRLNVAADGSLSVDSNGGGDTSAAVATVGLNAQEIIPVAGDDKVTRLLVPVIGGKQQGGYTNGNLSFLMSIPAFESWADGASYLLTGDSDPTKGTYDIRVLGASDLPDDDGDVYILTGFFNTDLYSGFKYRLYKTTVAKLLGAGGVPLSAAVTGSNPVLTVAEAGEKLSPTDLAPGVFYQIYFWDLLFEHGDTPAQNRLWFFRGTEILVTTASSYQSPETGGNAYKLFGPGHEMWDVCGHNVDAADLTNETVRQIRRGVSLKHGAKAMDAGISFGGGAAK